MGLLDELMFSGYFEEFLEFVDVMGVFFLQFTESALVDTTDELPEFMEYLFDGFPMGNLLEPELMGLDCFWIERSGNEARDG